MSHIDYDDLTVKYISELSTSNHIADQVSDQNFLSLISKNFKDNLITLLKKQKDQQCEADKE